MAGNAAADRDRANKANGSASASSQGKDGKQRQPAVDRIRKAEGASPSKESKEVEGLVARGYKLGRCVGKGAFGSVYQALNFGTGETVAIKQIKHENLPKSELKVIMLEIDLLRKLNHPNIVKYHGFVKSPDSLHIILEFCENGSLHSICKNFGKFPENLVGLYMAQALQGLLYLHEQGVIHRDIKGANILTTKEGLVKLADFGVATKSNASEYSVVGTPYWMAPEVIQLSGATTASDIWSLGCTVIELLDGKPPYHNLPPMPALFKIVQEDHPPLPEGVSPAVRDFLMQCFQKDPNLRVSAKKLLKHPWIVNAKKMDSVVSEQPTKYERAIKSVQQWNEAIKSPEYDSIRHIKSRPTSLSPMPSRKELTSASRAPPMQPKPLQLHTRPNPEAFKSPDLDASDNWDADFATSISPHALQLPMKPQDNFNGQLNTESLKSYAHFENSEMDDLRRVQDKQNEVDSLETVKPFTPKKVSSPLKLPGPLQNGNSHRVLREQIKIQKPKSAPKARPSSIFQEAIEDYSDLVDSTTDNDAFLKKVEALKLQDKSVVPQLARPQVTVHKNGSPSRKSSSLRRYPPMPEGRKRSGGGLQRTQSAVEIYKYAEDANEDPEAFLEKDVLLPVHGSDSSSEKGTLLVTHSKLSNSNSFDEEDDYDDPFAQFEEDFDQLDLEANVQRDRHARLCSLVEAIVADLQTFPTDQILADLIDQLLQVLLESPELKSVIITSRGMLPILEILDCCDNRDTALRLLKIINLIVDDNKDMLENLCFVGGIPIVSEFALKRFSSEIRAEAAAFIKQLCQTSTLALQMFVSCGGLAVLVGFLEEDMDSERDLIEIGVNGVCSVFELQGPTPKNDFCRILTRSSVLYPLSLALTKLLDERGPQAEEIVGKIVNIFLPFSQAENYVKEIVADRMVLKRVLKDLKRMKPSHQVTMLKFIKNLSMLATTHEALQNSNAIEVLTDLLASSDKLPQYREISNNVLHILFNLCRLSKTRQEDAALSGLIPLLQRVVKTERPLKELALPILCDMAHSGYVGRKVLWQHQGLQFYISLLSDKYWQTTALDAIFVWLQEETAKVEQHLLSGQAFSRAIVDCFNNVDASPDAFENFLDPLQKLLVLSPSVASTMAHPDIFARTGQKLTTKKAVVRGNLLRIIRSICDASVDQGGANLIREFGLYDAVERVADHDQAVMVRELALELVKACDALNEHDQHHHHYVSGYENASRSSSAAVANRPGTRRSSSSAMPSSSSPITSSPQLLRTGKSFLLLAESGNAHVGSGRTPRLSSAAITGPGASTPGSGNSFRPVSRDGLGSLNSSANGTNGTGSGGTKSRLPRTSHGPTKLSRLSLASQRREQQMHQTPTHAPVRGGARMSEAGLGSHGAASNVMSSSRSRIQQARQRRMTSGASGSSDGGAAR